LDHLGVERALEGVDGRGVRRAGAPHDVELEGVDGRGVRRAGAPDDVERAVEVARRSHGSQKI
jgi:hypothetical protein